MQGNRSRDTKPELLVRRAAHALGLRYRVNARPEPSLNRTADLLFPRAKVAVFIDGCYWHGCPEHCVLPATNAEFWAAKIDRNRERDRDTTAQLKALGWAVLRFWSHERAEVVAQTIRKAVPPANTRTKQCEVAASANTARQPAPPA